MTFDPNPLYFKMAKFFSDHKDEGEKVIICNEGSTRSSKTWDMIHLIVTYCDHNRGKGKDIYMLRDTLIACRDFLLKEVGKCFTQIGIPFNPILYPKPYLNLWGNNIYFRGLDDENAQEGYPSHVAFINEALDVKSYQQISGILMRCEELFAMDWNPKFSDHWAFAFEKRPNCLFTHSTYKDNKHLPKSIISEIESYDPSNPVNIANGTADDYRWKVYGLGLRASREGLIFPYVTWITEFPADVERVWYGLDFGFTNEPSALVRIAQKGNDLYLHELLYSPTETSELLYEIIAPIVGQNVIWADSADRYVGNQGSEGMVKELWKKGLKIFKVKKFPGSIQFGFDIMKRYKLNIVKTDNFVKEQENYSWRSINGIQINEPIGEFDHLWSGARYGCQMELAKRKGFTV